ncbi:MAG: hypothetical protein QNK40_12830 [Desulfobacterales bacterium]|nr:hypothetical protein [Desulfobacterales bacterium]
MDFKQVKCCGQAADLGLVEKMLIKGNKTDKTDLVAEKTKISDAYTHWIIPVQSKQYIETGDSAYFVIGIHPYAIKKATKKIDHDFDTSVTLFYPKD